MCLIERLTSRYTWSVVRIGRALGSSHSSLLGPAIMKKSDALFGLYPDLQRAVARLDGELAGEFIVEHWRLPIMRVCGE